MSIFFETLLVIVITVLPKLAVRQYLSNAITPMNSFCFLIQNLLAEMVKAYVLIVVCRFVAMKKCQQ